MIFEKGSKKSLKKMREYKFYQPLFAIPENCILEYEEIIADIIFLSF